MTWLPMTGTGTTEFARVFGLRPNLYEDYRAFVSVFRSLQPVNPVVLELCRLRVKQLLGEDVALHIADGARDANGLGREKLNVLERWREAKVFSAAERACLELTEKFVLNPHGITDEDAATVRAHFSDEETVAVLEALAIFDGFTRFRLILGIDPKEREE